MTANRTATLLQNASYLNAALYLLVAYLYFRGISYFSPAGVTATLSAQISPWLLALSVSFLGLSILKTVLKGQATTVFAFKPEWPQPSDTLLLLIPLGPIVQYIVLNQDILTPYGSAILLGQGLVTAYAAIIVLPSLFSIKGDRVIYLAIGLAFIYLIFYMPILAQDNNWHKRGSAVVQIPLFLVVLFLTAYIYKVNATVLKILAPLLFLSTVALAVLPKDEATEPPSAEKLAANPILQMLNEKSLTNKPDIYLLTYDAYVGNETMLQYGINNSQQEEFLLDQGFRIYEGTYSLAGSTMATMSRLLNASHDLGKDKNIAIAGNSRVHEALRDQGYTLGGIFKGTYFWGKNNPNLDVTFPPRHHKDSGRTIILQSILEGEFRFDAPESFQKIKVPQEDLIAEKRAFMSSSLTPKFLHTHTGPGHSQNSGKCRKDESTKFVRRLEAANEEMRADVKTVLKNKPNALIIINGDHGPQLTGNCTSLSKNKFTTKDKITRLEIQDRYGSFLAIKWPNDLIIYDQHIAILQDTFPAIFATLLDDESVLAHFDIDTKTVERRSVAGAYVDKGIIRGGVNDGEPLFMRTGVVSKE